MVSLVETLFGVAIASALLAIVLLVQRRRNGARRAGIVAVSLGGLAVAGEILLRVGF